VLFVNLLIQLFIKLQLAVSGKRNVRRVHKQRGAIRMTGKRDSERIMYGCTAHWCH